jgi:hypothetical protein
MDLIVQKAVELGAARIVPLLSDRTIVQIDAGEAAGKEAADQGRFTAARLDDGLQLKRPRVVDNHEQGGDAAQGLNRLKLHDRLFQPCSLRN